MQSDQPLSMHTAQHMDAHLTHTHERKPTGERQEGGSTRREGMSTPRKPSAPAVLFKEQHAPHEIKTSGCFFQAIFLKLSSSWYFPRYPISRVFFFSQANTFTIKQGWSPHDLYLVFPLYFWKRYKTRAVSSLYRLAPLRHTVTLPLSDIAGSRTPLFTVPRRLPHLAANGAPPYQGASQKLPSEYWAAIAARFSFFCFVISFNPWNTHPREDFGLRTLYYRILDWKPRCFYSQLQTEAPRSGGGTQPPLSRGCRCLPPRSTAQAVQRSRHSRRRLTASPALAVAPPGAARRGGAARPAPRRDLQAGPCWAAPPLSASSVSPSPPGGGRTQVGEGRCQTPWRRAGLTAGCGCRPRGRGWAEEAGLNFDRSEGGKEGRKAPLPGLRSLCAGECTSGRRVRGARPLRVWEGGGRLRRRWAVSCRAVPCPAGRGGAAAAAGCDHRLRFGSTRRLSVPSRPGRKFGGCWQRGEGPLSSELPVPPAGSPTLQQPPPLLSPRADRRQKPLSRRPTCRPSGRAGPPEAGTACEGQCPAPRRQTYL